MTDDEFRALQEAAADPWASYQTLIAYADELQARRPVGPTIAPKSAPKSEPKSEPQKNEQEMQDYLDALAKRAKRPMLRPGVYASHRLTGRDRRDRENAK